MKLSNIKMSEKFEIISSIASDMENNMEWVKSCIKSANESMEENPDSKSYYERDIRVSEAKITVYEFLLSKLNEI